MGINHLPQAELVVLHDRFAGAEIALFFVEQGVFCLAFCVILASEGKKRATKIRIFLIL